MLLLAWEGNFVVLSKTSHLRSPQVPLVRARDHQIPCVHPWSRPVRTSDNGYKMVQVHSDSLTWKWKMASWKTTFLYKQWVFSNMEVEPTEPMATVRPQGPVVRVVTRHWACTDPRSIGLASVHIVPPWSASGHRPRRA